MNKYDIRQNLISLGILLIISLLLYWWKQSPGEQLNIVIVDTIVMAVAAFITCLLLIYIGHKSPIRDILFTAFLILLHDVQLVVAFIFFERGAAITTMIFFGIQLISSILNFERANNLKAVVVLCSHLLVATSLANRLSTELYYHNINSDMETLAIGNFYLLVGLAFVFVLSIGSVMFARQDSVNKKEKEHL